LISKEILKKYDTKNMHLVYEEWPEMAKNAFEDKYEKYQSDQIDHIVFSGMGGSGTLGDIFAAILSKTKIHVSVVKGYLLPKTAGKNTLVVCTSISGNTIETLTVLNLAKKNNCKILAFSSGGKMEEYCKSNQIEFRKINQTHSPRASFPTFLYSMLNILEYVLPLKKEDIFESINLLKKLKVEISNNNLTEKNPAINLAEWITEIPIIYYPWGLQAAAIRYKNALQENTKMHVITEDVIEACHNEIVSWEKQKKFKPILIEGSDDYEKTKERWEIVREYFMKNNIDFKTINTVNGNILSKLINLIYLFDYSSIYSAVKLEIDPSPVNSIDYIKSKLD